MTAVLTPTLSNVHLRTSQRIWFGSWNAANLKAREAYERRLAEIDARDQKISRAANNKKLRKARIAAGMCSANRHKLAEAGSWRDSNGYVRCLGCARERHARKRRARGVLERAPRFTPEQGQMLRRQYEAGARVSDLVRQESASPNSVKKAIRDAGGTMRRPVDTRRLRRQLGERSA